MLIGIRHGRTSANEDGTETLRQPQDSLTNKGINESYNAADKIAKLKLNFNSFHTSPLKRAVQTADPIGKEIDMDPKQAGQLSDWNLGHLRGQSVKGTLKTVHNYIDNPDQKVPGGESFSTFTNRSVPFLKNLIESPDTHLIVSHNRVMTLLHALSQAKGGEIDANHMKRKGPIEPGGIIAINPDYEMNTVHLPEGELQHR